MGMAIPSQKQRINLKALCFFQIKYMGRNSMKNGRRTGLVKVESPNKTPENKMLFLIFLPSCDNALNKGIRADNIRKMKIVSDIIAVLYLTRGG
jgi:hypothetical protein